MRILQNNKVGFADLLSSVDFVEIPEIPESPENPEISNSRQHNYMKSTPSSG